MTEPLELRTAEGWRSLGMSSIGSIRIGNIEEPYFTGIVRGVVSEPGGKGIGFHVEKVYCFLPADIKRANELDRYLSLLQATSESGGDILVGGKWNNSKGGVRVYYMKIEGADILVDQIVTPK